MATKGSSGSARSGANKKSRGSERGGRPIRGKASAGGVTRGAGTGRAAGRGGAGSARARAVRVGDRPDVPPRTPARGGAKGVRSRASGAGAAKGVQPQPSASRGRKGAEPDGSEPTRVGKGPTRPRGDGKDRSNSRSGSPSRRSRRVGASGHRGVPRGPRVSDVGVQARPAGLRQGGSSGGARRDQRPSGPPVSSRSLQEEIRRTARTGQGDRALRAFEQAVSLLERGREDAAVRAALEAKELAGRSGAVREVLGIALYGAGRYRDALRELQAYRRLTGRVDQNHLIADSQRALGHPERAVEPAREALRARISDEARAEAAVVAAAALSDLGRPTEAMAILNAFPTDSRKARAFDLRVWYAAGDILSRAGREEEAAVYFRKIVRHDPAAFDAAERLESLR
jgi:tetratricopeptide repeat protein